MEATATRSLFVGEDVGNFNVDLKSGHAPNLCTTARKGSNIDPKRVGSNPAEEVSKWR